ncbi:helicase HerA-like domain-containing protein [Microbacterium amylolyticum]|uniref:DNA helicase HerA-like ATPase n=1 Tax=Microbacterium amylolyticum TaxID=936337 RepID=A0ABS4ZJ37_9MICO|nr:helicase HerA-like domain-containing protein [Microbacterium amylolyticum]MBP2437302.1 DNA helicase HerA-like ATPase [Microbacterium amylolyticum]
MAEPETPDAELVRLRAEAEAARAALELAEKNAALAAAEAAAASRLSPEKAQDDKPAATATAETVEATGPLTADQVQAVVEGYAFAGESLDVGVLVNGSPDPKAQIRIPLRMLNRHGLIAGATGTGKTRTLQGIAEQLADKGVPVFAADMKGDLSGVAVAGEASEGLLRRTAGIGQDWQPKASATEFFALGGDRESNRHSGIPVRATVSGFGPLLLSKVLGLNSTQESSLQLVFHYADQNGLALVDLKDLRAVLSFLTSDRGKDELAAIGGISKATAGVILRELVAFAADGAEQFFGEPEFDVSDFIRHADDGRGILNLLELPNVATKPALFSTFIMYLLAELFETLPEVGDPEKPKLVFFFDEAHLLFRDASKDFLASIVQTVRLIRSKGVGVFFITQTPKDVPSDVLAQLGSRVQHALRAFTPDDAKALKATVRTYPTSGYDLDRVLQELGTGEAIVTVMNEKGAPTPVAWTRVLAPAGLMTIAPDGTIEKTMLASPLLSKYADAIDAESAHEILTAKMNAADAAERAAEEEAARLKAEAEANKEREKADREYAKALAASQRQQATPRTRTAARRPQKSVLDEVLGSALTKQVVNGVVRGLFGNGRRR